MSEWISVKDRLPKMKSCVLAVNQFGEMSVSYREKRWKGEPERWYMSQAEVYEFIPTHWMPLPEAPKDCR